MTSHSPEFLSDVFKAIDGTPRSSNEIHRRLGCWAPTSVRKALEKLHQQGLAVREIRQLKHGVKYFYHVSPGTPGHPLTDPLDMDFTDARPGN